MTDDPVAGIAARAVSSSLGGFRAPWAARATTGLDDKGQRRGNGSRAGVPGRLSKERQAKEPCRSQARSPGPSFRMTTTMKSDARSTLEHLTLRRQELNASQR